MLLGKEQLEQGVHAGHIPTSDVGRRLVENEQAVGVIAQRELAFGRALVPEGGLVEGEQVLIAEPEKLGVLQPKVPADANDAPPDVEAHALRRPRVEDAVIPQHEVFARVEQGRLLDEQGDDAGRCGILALDGLKGVYVGDGVRAVDPQLHLRVADVSHTLPHIAELAYHVLDSRGPAPV